MTHSLMCLNTLEVSSPPLTPTKFRSLYENGDGPGDEVVVCAEMPRLLSGRVYLDLVISPSWRTRADSRSCEDEAFIPKAVSPKNSYLAFTDFTQSWRKSNPASVKRRYGTSVFISYLDPRVLVI